MENIKMMYSSPILAAFGNPLLDMSVSVTNVEDIKMYDLPLDGEKEIVEDLSIFENICKKYVVQYNPGGSSLNTLRMFQWLIGYPFYSVFFGGIGYDENGGELENMVQHSGVLTRYAYNEDFPTGRCLALINGPHRSLVANLGAANIFEPSQLLEPKTTEILEEVKMIYIEGFFLSHSFTTALELVQYCQRKQKVLAFNLNSVYICKNYSIEVLKLVKSADILFGNTNEYKALGTVMQLKETKVKDIAITVQNIRNLSRVRDEKSNLPLDKLSDSDMGNITIVTQSNHPVICIYGKVNTDIEVEVPSVSHDLIKDTTGAGDSFVAGFLTAVFAKKDVVTCIRWGCWTARQVIQQIGCHIPNYSPEGIMKL